MILRYGHICEWATLTYNHRMTIGGVLDGFWIAYTPPTEEESATPALARSYVLPSFFLAFCVEASAMGVGAHDIIVRILDEDAQEQGKLTFQSVQFGQPSPERPGGASLLQQVHNLTVPGPGHFLFEVWIAGQRIGEIPFYVLPTPS